jgi:cytochrome c55X
MQLRPLPALAAASLVAAAAQAQQTPPAAPVAAPDAQRRAVLVRMVRQDCGACHGMRLGGGLGPPLTPQALSERPLQALVATTLFGRPGTPMPAWQTLLSEADALWIAQQLQAGLPAETALVR